MKNVINISKGDPNLPPSFAKPAATVMLVRPNKSHIEVFMILRNRKTNFGGAWVFPGGKLELSDSHEITHQYCKGLSDKEASKILNVDRGGLNYWIACIRECFEESGILLAYRNGGGLFDSMTEKEKKSLDYYRRNLNKGKTVLLNLCEELEIKLAVDQLAYVSHWVTPKSELKRYNTRFFIGLAPSLQKADHDGSESVDSLWINPEQALNRADSSNFPILRPTKKNLEALLGYEDVNKLVHTKMSRQNMVLSTDPKVER